MIKEKELVELDSNRSVVEGGSGKGKKREISPAVILQQIQMLRGDLGIIESVGGVLEGNGEREEDGMFQRVMASSNLLSKLGHPLPEADSTKASTSSNAIASSSQNIRVVEGDLEKRLAEIERVVGANESSVDEVSFNHIFRISRMYSNLRCLYISPISVESTSNTFITHNHTTRSSPYTFNSTKTFRFYFSSSESFSIRS